MYKKIRFYSRLLVAFTSKYLLLIVLGMVLSGITSLVTPRLIPYLPRFHSVKNIGLIGRYTLSDLPAAILFKISLGLTAIDANGSASAGLAAYWSISPDGKTFLFHLKPGLHWQDGSRLISRDIKYQFHDAVFSYPDDQTISVALKDAFSPLPVLLSHPVLKVINSRFLSGTKLIGAGNYTIHGFKTNGDQLDTMDLYPVDMKSDLPILKYFFYPSVSQIKTSFKLGLLDEIEDIGVDPADLNSWPDAQIVAEVLHNRYIGVFFNTQDPYLSGADGKNLRLALTYAIDKSRWPNRAIGPINPDSWAFNPDIKKYDYDLTKAVDLVKKVGKLPSTLRLSTVPSYFDIADQVKNDWSKLNIKTEISVSPDIPSNFQILLVAQAIPLDPDQYNLWHSTQDITNLTHLNNPRIDKLLEDGRKTYDQNARQKIYQDFQKYLVEEDPAVFLFYPPIYTVYKK